MDLPLHGTDLRPVSFWIGVESRKYVSFLAKKKKNPNRLLERNEKPCCPEITAKHWTNKSSIYDDDMLAVLLCQQGTEYVIITHFSPFLQPKRVDLGLKWNGAIIVPVLFCVDLRIKKSHQVNSCTNQPQHSWKANSQIRFCFGEGSRSSLVLSNYNRERHLDT